MRSKYVLFGLIFVIMFSSKTIAGKNIILPGDEDYLPIADVMPEPTDGLANLMKKVNYPSVARSAGIEGRVIAMAYINENGGVDDVKIIKGIGGGCNEEVERVLRASKFKPGEKDGKPVKVKLTMSFVFKLN
ncbi:MAG: energy transducer TonB [Melioribacteraceae bacterium]